MPIPEIHRFMSPVEWALLLALSVLWGGSFFFVGVAVTELPPFTIVVVRVGLAALALNIVVRAVGLRMPAAPKIWLAFLAMGLLNNAIPFSLIVWGQTQIASGLASILNATTPLFTLLAAHLFTRDEKMSSGRLAGVVIGLAGVVMMVGADALESLGTDVVAQLACLGGAVSYAVAGVYGRRFKMMGVAPLVTATGQVTASTALLLPVMLILDRPWSLAVPSGATIAAVVGLALLSTALAYVIYFRLLETAGATNLLLVTLLIPVTAIILGVSFLQEQLEPIQALGMAIIAVGLAAIDGRPATAGTRLLARSR